MSTKNTVFTVLSFFLTSLNFNVYAGENKSAKDKVFNEEATSGWTQVLLGFVDFGFYHGLATYECLRAARTV